MINDPRTFGVVLAEPQVQYGEIPFNPIYADVAAAPRLENQHLEEHVHARQPMGGPQPSPLLLEAERLLQGNGFVVFFRMFRITRFDSPGYEVLARILRLLGTVMPIWREKLLGTFSRLYLYEKLSIIASVLAYMETSPTTSYLAQLPLIDYTDGPDLPQLMPHFSTMTPDTLAMACNHLDTFIGSTLLDFFKIGNRAPVPEISTETAPDPVTEKRKAAKALPKISEAKMRRIAIWENLEQVSEETLKSLGKKKSKPLVKTIHDLGEYLQPPVLRVSSGWGADVIPPILGGFPDSHSILLYLVEWGRHRGVSFIKSNSNERASRFLCDCHKERSAHNYAKSTGDTFISRRDCSFLLRGRLDDDGNWYIALDRNPDTQRHSHPPSAHPNVHYRKLPAETTLDMLLSEERDLQVTSSEDASHDEESGQSVKKTKKQQPAKEIVVHWNKFYSGGDEADSLIRMLNEARHYRCVYRIHAQDDKDLLKVDYSLGPKPPLKDLFFAHIGALNLAKTYPEVMVVDAAYNTNRYFMKMVNLIGIDSCNKTFPIASAWIRHEDTETLQWVFRQARQLYDDYSIPYPKVVLMDPAFQIINSSKAVFPDATVLLCIWHVNKTVSLKARRIIKNPGIEAEFKRLWDALLASPSESEFSVRYGRIKHSFARFPALIKYLRHQWEKTPKDGGRPLFTMFVRCWSQGTTLYFNMASSRVEYMHAFHKKRLSDQTKGLFSATINILASQVGVLSDTIFTHANGMFRLSKILTHPLLGGFFDGVLQVICHDGLTKVEEQRQLMIAEPDSVCTNSFSTDSGLPCSHKLAEIMASGRRLRFDDFHPRWRYLHVAVQREDLMHLRLQAPRGAYYEDWTSVKFGKDAMDHQHVEVCPSGTDVLLVDQPLILPAPRTPTMQAGTAGLKSPDKRAYNLKKRPLTDIQLARHEMELKQWRLLNEKYIPTTSKVVFSTDPSQEVSGAGGSEWETDCWAGDDWVQSELGL